MADRVNPFDDALRQALATASRRRSYNPGIGAFETATTQEIVAAGWHGDYRWPVHKDPIFTPIFTAILGTGGFTLFGTTISYAAIASAIATTAIVAGVQYLLTPKPPKPEDGRAPMTQPIPYRFWGVGEARLAGAMMLWEALDNRIFSVQAIVGHRINAFTGYYLNDDKVEVVDGHVESPGGGRYVDDGRDLVFVFPRLGLVPETPIADFVTLLSGQGIWTNDHRGDGQASIGMVCIGTGADNFLKCFPYGKPTLSVVAQLALVWDFRDPAQDPEDPSTWTFSKNSILILAWHECFNPFGTKRDYRKALLPVLDMWQEEADVCDEDVPRAIGGTEKRYECGGFETTEHDPKGATNAILASCDGWMCERGDGALLVVAGKFREKYVATLTDADIVGHTIQHDVLFEEEVNRFIPKFTYPATDYTTTDTDYFEDTAAQLSAGRVLPQDGNYIWVQQWRQARRLGKREFDRIRAKVRGTLDIRFTGINAVYAPWFRLSTPNRLPAQNGQLFSNRRSVLSVSRGGFQMTFIKMPPNIDAFDPATDEGAAPPVPAKPVSDGIPKPIIDTLAPISSGGSVYIRAALVDPSRDDLTPVIRYRISDVGGGVPGAWIEQKFPGAAPAAGLIVLNTNPVPNNNTLDIEAAYIGSNNAYGDWSDTQTVVSTVDTVAPVALVAASITGTGPYLGNAPFSITTANDLHLSRIALYRVPAGGVLNKATHLVRRIGVSPGSTFSYVDGDATITNLFTDPGFATGTGWNFNAGWTLGTGKADHASAADGGVSQTFTYVSSVLYRYGFTIVSQSAAGTGVNARFGPAPLVVGSSFSGVGKYFGKLTPNSANNVFGYRASTWVGSVDDAVYFKETATCAPQGAWDYYLIPENVSGIEGPASGPLTMTIY